MNYGTNRIQITNVRRTARNECYAVYVDGKMVDAYGYDGRDDWEGERWAWGMACKSASQELHRLRYIKPPIRMTCPVYIQKYSTGYSVYAVGIDRRSAVKHVCAVLRAAGHKTLTLQDVVDLRRQGETEPTGRYTVDYSPAALAKIDPKL